MDALSNVAIVENGPRPEQIKQKIAEKYFFSKMFSL
jgi:hypothetical protein